MKIILNFENIANFNYDENLIRKIFKNFLEDKIIYEKSCLNDLSYNSIFVDFVFCDNDFIHKINKEYRDIDKPTDVISFALFCDDPFKINTKEINLGEIIVSIDTAKKQAEYNHHSVKKEVYYLISHGLLHLLGFDHMTDEEYNFMVEKQNNATKDIK